MTFRPDATDIVIPIMGPTGVGKSTFINQLLRGPEGQSSRRSQTFMQVGRSLSSCTMSIQPALLRSRHRGSQIFLVDTPGFHGSPENDQAIIGQIADWLKNSYKDPKSVLAGVIYMYDISEDRFNGAAQRILDLDIFKFLCGASAFDKVIIGTTKHSRIESNQAAARDKELREAYWKPMISKGTLVLPYRDDYQSAWAIIDHILERSFRPEATDIVIPIMGPTGVGKSTFINELLRGPKGQSSPRSQIFMKVGETLSSCTSSIQPALLHSRHQGSQIFLVDTPGFDDSHGNDRAIIEQIANWLKNSYEDPKSVLAGVIYMHDISQDRFNGAALRSLNIFKSLCGAPAFDKVIIGTTKHSRIESDEAATRDEELREAYWESMISKGTLVFPYTDDYQSACAIIDHILERSVSDTVLEIQKELAIQKKEFPQTKVGKEFIRQKLLEIANQRAIASGVGDAKAVERFQREEKKLLKQLQLDQVPAPLLLRIRKTLTITRFWR